MELESEINDITETNVQLPEAKGLAAYLRNVANKVEKGKLCNGEAWDRLMEDGPQR